MKAVRNEDNDGWEDKEEMESMNQKLHSYCERYCEHLSAMRSVCEEEHKRRMQEKEKNAKTTRSHNTKMTEAKTIEIVIIFGTLR